MENKKLDKVNEIFKYLEELGAILPTDFVDYIENFEKRAACERYFEKIIESVVDLAYFILKERKLAVPEEEESTFMILAGEKIIPQELAKKLKDAKGMRNIIAHDYGKIDDELVFEAITEELGRDVQEFIEQVQQL